MPSDQPAIKLFGFVTARGSLRLFGFLASSKEESKTDSLAHQPT